MLPPVRHIIPMSDPMSEAQATGHMHNYTLLFLSQRLAQLLPWTLVLLQRCMLTLSSPPNSQQSEWMLALHDGTCVQQGFAASSPAELVRYLRSDALRSAQQRYWEQIRSTYEV